ncbi:hypothetical protein Syun_011672 [Stephania yunnanensis]|uniref:Uncharacterized protein n=1 Tax=Stephania yunnanensis TaxID=152371 RepID=A0AAP0JXZ4_9MAGN
MDGAGLFQPQPPPPHEHQQPPQDCIEDLEFTQSGTIKVGTSGSNESKDTTTRPSLIICFWGIEGIHFAEYVALSNGDCGAWSFNVTGEAIASLKWNHSGPSGNAIPLVSSNNMLEYPEGHG